MNTSPPIIDIAFCRKDHFQFNMIFIPELRIEHITSISVYAFGVPLWRRAKLTHTVQTQNLTSCSWLFLYRFGSFLFYTRTKSNPSDNNKPCAQFLYITAVHSKYLSTYQLHLLNLSILRAIQIDFASCIHFWFLLFVSTALSIFHRLTTHFEFCFILMHSCNC